MGLYKVTRSSRGGRGQGFQHLGQRWVCLALLVAWLLPYPAPGPQGQGVGLPKPSVSPWEGRQLVERNWRDLRRENIPEEASHKPF